MMLRILCCSFLLIASLGAAHAADRLITVTGEGSVALAPDIAVIRIGVSTQGKTAAEASNANAQKMAAVLGAIKDAGIAERDVQTAALSVQPQYDSSKPGTPRLIGFQVSNQVTVKIRDIKELPNLIDRAISDGANEMSGIEFVVGGGGCATGRTRRADAEGDRDCELYAGAVKQAHR